MLTQLQQWPQLATLSPQVLYVYGPYTDHICLAADYDLEQVCAAECLFTAALFRVLEQLLYSLYLQADMFDANIRLMH